MSDEEDDDQPNASFDERYPPRDDGHPFNPVPGTEAENFIQWKGTNICIDVYCRCDGHFHVDGMFAHFMRCPYCGTVYQAGTQVKMIAVDPSAAYIEPRTDENPGIGGSRDG